MSIKTYTQKIPPTLTDIEYYILMTILQQPRHGIGIFEHVASQTGNQLVLSPGTLYAALKRMYASGWIEMVTPADGDDLAERRKFYLATELGAAMIREKVCWFAHELERAQAILTSLPPEINQPEASDSPILLTR